MNKILVQGNFDVYETIIKPHFTFNDNGLDSTYWLFLNFDDWTYSYVDDFKSIVIDELVFINELESMVRKRKIEEIISDDIKNI